MLITDKDNLTRFYARNRLWQGIPAIERTEKGRLFAAWYSGGTTEELGNYALLVVSDDDGDNWSEPIAVAYEGEDKRAYDQCLWIDPLGRLWFIWSVMPEHHVEYVRCDKPDAEVPEWTAPVSFANDVMMNKPTVLCSGDWLFPVAVWGECVNIGSYATKNSPALAFVYKSSDNGQSFTRLGGVDMPKRSFDEHMVVEMADKSLLMLVRTTYGIGKSVSRDGGITWSAGEDSALGGPCSRFFIRRLSSGNILLINHYNFKGRNNLTAMVSRDECATWEGFLMLDERDNVSYPDGVETKDGWIYAVYDRERGASYGGRDWPEAAKEILMAKFTEQDVLAGRLVDRESKLKVTINKLN